MTRKEIVTWWSEDPTQRKFKVTKDVHGNDVPFGEESIVKLDQETLRWKNGTFFSLHYAENDLSEFEPIQELRKMSFGEAMYYYYVEDRKGKDIISVSNGCTINCGFTHMTKDEFLGEWTVEGVYEE